MDDYNIKLSVFEGPFDLLLSLLEKNKIDITEVSISVITDQYIDFIFSDGFNIEIATEFLVIAATLIHLKSKKLLPVEQKEEEEITEEDLIKRLIRYKHFKEVSVLIEEKMESWYGALYKPAEKLSFAPREEQIDLDLFQLSNCYAGVHSKFTESRNDNKGRMHQILEIEKVSLKEKIKHIINVIKIKTQTTFKELFNLKNNSKTEIVTGFLAILELNRSKKIRLVQTKPFGEIQIYQGEDTTNILPDMEDEYD